MYSFSTCWNSHRHTDGRAMLEEIRDLGFEFAELSHGIRLSLVPGIMQAVEAGVIKISTLHNFCPLPIGCNHANPNVFKFSSTNARERDNAYKHTMKTIEMADQLGAELIVLHMGEIDMRNYTDKLIDLLEAGKQDSPKYQKLCQAAELKREKKKAKACDLAYGMLERIAEQSSLRGIKLGIEIRESLEEIPIDTDWDFFFQRFDDPNICYWHDIGHAQIKENLGFIHHRLHLESMSGRLGGFHLHDVQFPVRDHRPPGRGMIDFEGLKHVVKSEHIKVFELSPSLKPDAAKEGVAHLKAIWGED
ncbi:MAG: TIM barrel protein [Verrucomicrobiota bacterium]|jgi:sugar phosphate isomerase/epimerase|nr:TIM barrel protein [Verrucomicrobiota bacterium]MDP7048842.1 TIM barrel protein [Verrucomicrobiota bacterium]